MRLQQWAASRWLGPILAIKQRYSDLFAIVERDLDDSARDLSPDWQFGIAYIGTSSQDPPMGWANYSINKEVDSNGFSRYLLQGGDISQLKSQSTCPMPDNYNNKNP